MSDGGETVTDVDTLQGQALADAVAVEVMGWRLSDGGHYWLPDELPRYDWQPLSSWSDFGCVVDRMGALGLRMALRGDPGSAFLETGCRAALKAVRAKEAADQ